MTFVFSFSEYFLSVRAMYLLFSSESRDSYNLSKQRRIYRRRRSFLSLLDLRNRACVTSLLRTRMARRARWILFLHASTAKTKDRSFRFLILRSTRASMFMLRTESLLSIYLRIELQRICRYVLRRRENQRAVEARLKYLILGAFRSGILLFGLPLIYRRSGTLRIGCFATTIYESELFTAGMTLLRRGLFFKAGRRPFHFWVPDVYQGIPTLSRAYFRTVSKRRMLGLLLILPISTTRIWRVRRRSMLLGVLGAIPQFHLKRLYRYSSIAQVGYICLGLLSVEKMSGVRTRATAGVIRYLLIYIRTTLHRFSVFAVPSYTTFAHMQESSYVGMKVQMRLVFFSLAGIPPLLGFRAKARVLQNASYVGEMRRVRLALLASSIGVFYSLKMIQTMFYRPVSKTMRREIPRVQRTFLCRPVIFLTTGLFGLILESLHLIVFWFLPLFTAGE